MTRLTLRGRTALAIGAGFLAVAVVLLGLVGVLYERAIRAETASSTSQLRDELGLAADEDVEVLLQVPGGRSVPVARLNDIVAGGSEAVRADVQRGLAVALPVAALLAGLGGWWLSGRVTRPLHRIASIAGRVSSDRLDARIDHDGPDDEIRNLAEAIDRMMARLQHAFEVQGTFASAASHELRTPLTIVRTELDVAMASDRLDRDELDEMATAIRDALGRAERTIDALLVLGRAGIVDAADTVDLGELVRSEAERLDPSVPIDLDVGSEAVVPGDRVLLGRLVRNLLDNAVLHNDDRGVVRVRVVRPIADGAVVVVENTGPTLDEDTISQLTEPFRRAVADPRRVPGSGLGLAIVEAVVEGHGGHVRLVGRSGGGLVAHVELPASD